MIRVLHLLDRSAGWEQRAAIAQLAASLPAHEYAPTVASIDRDAPGGPDWDGIAVEPARGRLGFAALAAPAVRRLARQRQADVIHAWGPRAALAARAAWPDHRPLAVTIFDPDLTHRDVRMLRTVAASRRFAVACAAARVRQRLVERGLPLPACALIRPAVDFAALTAARAGNLRRDLGLPDDARLVLTPPLSNPAGQTVAVWSVLVRSYLGEPWRIVVPGQSAALRRLRWLSKTSVYEQMVWLTGDRWPFEGLVAVADYLVLGGTTDTSMTAVAWAMAAGVPVISPATCAVSEFLADDVNAVLFQAPPIWRQTGTRICALYDRTANLPRIRETARGQAYQLFSVRRFADQHRRLYRNLLDDRPAADGILDPAVERA